MFCIHCGSKLPDGAKFCLNCGAAISAGSVPAEKKKPEASSASKIGQQLISCTVCGSTNLRPVQRGIMRCEYCGSKFRVDEENRIKSAEEVDAQVMSVFIKAAEFELKNDTKNELETLSSAIPIAPDNSLLMVKLGRAYRRLGFYSKALEYYQKAITLDPNQATGYSNIGAVYLSTNQYAKAKPYYEKAIAMIQNDPTTASKGDQATMLGNYALCIGLLGELKQAKRYLEEAQKLGYDPNNVKAIQDRLGLKSKR